MLNFIKLRPGEKKPDQKSLDDFYTDLSKLDNAAILLNKETVVVDFDEFPEIGRKLLEKYPTMAFETKRGIQVRKLITKQVINQQRPLNKTANLEKCMAHLKCLMIYLLCHSNYYQ